MITHDQALNSDDTDIKEFAKSLDENYLLIDMRNAQINDLPKKRESPSGGSKNIAIQPEGSRFGR